MVNEMRDEGKRRVESDRHATLTPADPSMMVLLAHLILHADDYRSETDTWGMLNRSATICTGEITQWKEPAALTVRRVGGRWPHLQLLSYAIAYPALMDDVTTAVGAVQRRAEPG